MKVFRFYKLIKGISDEIAISDKYPLVAITSNKRLAKDFEKTRNMSKYVKIVDSMSNEEYAAYSNRHSGEELDEKSLLLSYGEDKENPKEIYLPHTHFEYTYIQSSIDNIMLGADGPACDVSLLNKKYVKVLDLLGYTQLAAQNLKIADDYDMSEFVYDELSAFISIYKEFLNI